MTITVLEVAKMGAGAVTLRAKANVHGLVLEVVRIIVLAAVMVLAKPNVMVLARLNV